MTVSFVYNANVDLDCSTSGNFYATKDGVTTQVTQTETSDKYKINGNVLTIKSLSKLHLIQNLNDMEFSYLDVQSLFIYKFLNTIFVKNPI